MAFEVRGMSSGDAGGINRAVFFPTVNQLTFFKDGWKIIFPVVDALDELDGACRLNTKP